jgi:hypothetical protein
MLGKRELPTSDDTFALEAAACIGARAAAEVSA